MARWLAWWLLAAAASVQGAEPVEVPPAASADGGGAAAAPAAPKGDEENDKLIEEAMAFIATGKPADGLPVLDRVIADEEKRNADERRQVYSARSLAETLAYTLTGATAKKDVVVFGPTWSTAVYLKGYALIDLNRGEEARPFLERAVALSPMNSRYLGELAEWHKGRHDWTTSYDLFEKALAAADVSPDDARLSDRGRALRGMGFARIEQDRLDEAEALFNRALELDPADPKAKNELAYIRQQRAKKRPPPTS